MSMLPGSSRVKPKSPGVDLVPNPKTSVTCNNVPEGLFDATAAKKHFSKFGRVQRIRLFPKRQMCIIEYDQPMSVKRAVLNAGAFDGFMFDVTRTKPRMRKKSKVEDDPDWVPDADVEEELSAMSGTPIYRLSRQKPMELDPAKPKLKTIKRVINQSPKKTVFAARKQPIASQPTTSIEPPVAVTTTQTTLSTSEAAVELQQLAAKVSLTPDEQWRILDARDRILRGWGGAGARVKVGGATIGTCQDMCPEKELLHRLSEYQVMTLETVADSEGQLDRNRAVKQYSRSSADQEIPMCYELRPAPVLLRTCSYLLHEIADTTRPISLADWFHFMWDRFRSIRKDIAQQALCCAESIRLVEMCARFHAHCAARLADLEHTQFDQKLNTDNLTKCLQTLKYMYSDVTADKRPMEAEFRGYIALLNLGDANFWWEIKHLPQEIQKSEPITFAIQVFNALDNNNYVRFFRLVREKATYLQACILLRYFNDVRARALARIVKAYAPRGQYVYPVSDLMNALAFESIENMKAFIIHYGLRYESLDNNEPVIILSRNQFIEDSDPFPIARSVNLIESKRQSSVGQVIAGGNLPNPEYRQHVLYTSFTKDGKLKEAALVAEDQGFSTENDSNKDVKALKAEIQRLAQGGRSYANTEVSVETARSNEVFKSNQFVKPEVKDVATKPKSIFNTPPTAAVGPKKLFSFKPAIPVASVDVIKNSPEKVFDVDAKSIFSFSKPQEPAGANLFTNNAAGVFASTLKNAIEKKAGGDTSLFDSKISDSTTNAFSGDFSTPNNVPGVFQKKPDVNVGNIFANKSAPPAYVFENKSTTVPKNVFVTKSTVDPKNVFGRTVAEKKEPFQNAQNVFKNTNTEKSLFSKPDPATSIFGQNVSKPAEKDLFANNQLVSKSGLVLGDNQNKDNQANAKSIFASAKENSLFSKPDPPTKFETGGNLFSKAIKESESAEAPKNVFAAFNKASEPKPDPFKMNSTPFDTSKNVQSTFAPNGDQSPGTFFKSVLNPPNGSDAKGYSIFQTKNKAQTVADNILNSISSTGNTVYDFDQNNEDQQNQLTLQRLQEEELKKEQERQLQLQREEEQRQQELRRLEELRQEEIKRQNELRRQEELKRREEEKKKQEEIRIMEEKRKREEQRKQEVLRKRLEEERKAELKRKAEEEERKFREAVEKESTQLVEELVDEVNNETNRELLKEEEEKYRILVKLATDTTESITTELCREICHSELNAEMFLTYKIMKKWFYVWRHNLFRNLKRRRLLDDTPVWLPERTPVEEASCLRRKVENSALKNMNNIHRGYKFSGELKLPPPPEPYKLMDLIRSPLLKRMKEIQYPYDKCFFWKVTLVAPDDNKWLCKKINVQKWLIDAFSDNKQHVESETLIHVGKESWNHLMDFAISVSLVNKNDMNNCVEAIEGTNGIIFYLTETDHNMIDTIELTLKHKYPYQIVPVAVIMPKMKSTSINNAIQNLLDKCVQNKIISGYKIFILEHESINELLHASTKKALKWVAKKYPLTPPLEIDHLKSICERYLGNEIWCRFRTERDSRMGDVIKDIRRLINCYNEAVERLTRVLTNDDLFNYASFPLEFNKYLDHASPYPKPYEFITSNVRTSENVSTIRDILRQLKLPNPSTGFKPLDVVGMQNQIRTYCNQIGWFEDPEQVVCKVVAVIPNELTDMNVTQEDFTQYFAQYDLIDFLNIIVYEKIKGLNRFDNRYAIYEKTVLQEYRSMDWLYDVEALSQMKHKVIEYEDDIDCFIEAKRRKIALESMEYLMLEDKDSTLVEENIKETDANITKYSHCSEAVEQLEKEIEEGKKKAIEFENMLRAALADV